MNANAFNFSLGDVSSGNHTVTVQARIALNNSVQTGEVKAQAFLGKGSVFRGEYLGDFVRKVCVSDLRVRAF